MFELFGSEENTTSSKPSSLKLDRTVPITTSPVYSKFIILVGLDDLARLICPPSTPAPVILDALASIAALPPRPTFGATLGGGGPDSKAF